MKMLEKEATFLGRKIRIQFKEDEIMLMCFFSIV